MEYKDIVLIVLVVGMLFMATKVYKNNNIEKFEQEQVELIKEEINRQYNMDIEAIRNLGAISKSLLTGKNYHNTEGVSPGVLTIPANVVIEGNMIVKGTTELSDDINMNADVNIQHGKHLYFNSDVEGKKSDLFFNNTGLEIAQRNCDRLRLYQNNKGIDITGTKLKGDGENVTVDDTLVLNGNFKTRDTTLEPFKFNFLNRRYRTARFIMIHGRGEWLHFTNFRVYTLEGEELITKQNSFNGNDSNPNYIIPDNNFTCSGDRNGHSGHRQPYKVRPPHPTIRNDNEDYYHSSHPNNPWWQVDLGKEYNLIKIEYWYRHYAHRQYNDPKIQDALELKNNSGNRVYYKLVSNGSTKFGHHLVTEWDLTN